METQRETSAWYCFDRKDSKKEDFDTGTIVYENHVNVKNLDNHFGGFQGLLQSQS